MSTALTHRNTSERSISLIKGSRTSTLRVFVMSFPTDFLEPKALGPVGCCLCRYVSPREVAGKQHKLLLAACN